MPYWVQALLWGAAGLVIYLLLLKRLRRTHRPKDVPEIVIRPEDEAGTGASPGTGDERKD